MRIARQNGSGLGQTSRAKPKGDGKMGKKSPYAEKREPKFCTRDNRTTPHRPLTDSENGAVYVCLECGTEKFPVKK